MADIFQVVDQLDSDKKDMIATRLEARAAMESFASIRKSYFDRLGLLSEKQIHELGCGTGPICRAIAQDPAFEGHVSGSDLSISLIEQAQVLAKEAGLHDVDFFLADGQGSDAHAGAYDVVLAHTLFSHVADPTAVIKEMRRLTKPGGRLIIHDGDFASFTLSTGRADLDRRMLGKYFKISCHSPDVMREMPILLKQSELEVEEVFGDMVVEVGKGAFFPTWAENMGPVAVAAGVAEEVDVLTWGRSIAASREAGTFYGACNFMTYSVRVPR